MESYVGWLGVTMGIVTPMQWQSTPVRQVQLFRGYTPLKKHGGLIALINRFLPKAKTRSDVMPKPKHLQALLMDVVQTLFPSECIQMDYHHSDLHFQSSKIMELDLFLPNLAIALEFQGPQHYHQIYTESSTQQQMINDIQKKKRCKEAGITLIQVPYWQASKNHVFREIKSAMQRLT